MCTPSVIPGHAPDAAAVAEACAPWAAGPKGWVSFPRCIVALPHLAANSWQRHSHPHAVSQGSDTAVPCHPHHSAAIRPEKRIGLFGRREAAELRRSRRRHPEFAAELPRFQAAVWEVFDPYELAGYLASQRTMTRSKLQRLLYMFAALPVEGK